MAITPYSPIAQQPLINTYVPLPYDDLLKAGLSKQAQYNAGEAAIGALEDELLKISNLPQDTPGRDQYINEIKGKLSSKLEEYGTDFSKMLPYTKQLAKQVKEDFLYGKPAAMQKNLASYQSYVKDLDAMLAKGTKEGGITKNDYDYLKNKAFNEYQGIGEKNAEGNYNSLKTTTPAGYIDVNQKALDVAKGITETQLSSGKWEKKPGLPGYFEKITGKGVTFDDVYNMAYSSLATDESVKPFLQQQYERDLYENKSEYGYNYRDPLTGQMTTYKDPSQERFFNQRIGDAAKIAAEKQSHIIYDDKQLRDTRAQDALSWAKVKALQEPITKYQTVEPAITANAQANPYKGTGFEQFATPDLEFTDKGNPMFKVRTVTPAAGSAGSVPGVGPTNGGGVASFKLGADGKYVAVLPKNVMGVDADKINKFVTVLNEYKNKNKAFEKMTPQAIMGAVGQANADSFAYTYKELDPTNLDKGKLSEDISSNLAAGKLKISFSGDYSPLKNEDVYKKMGINEKDLAKQIKELQAVGINPAKGGYTIKINDSNGNPVALDITGFQEMGEQFALPKAVSEVERKGEVGKKTVRSGGKTYELNTQLAPNSQTGKWAYTTDVIEQKIFSKRDSETLVKQSGKSKATLISEGLIKDNKDGTITLLTRINDIQDEAKRIAEEWGDSEYMTPMRLKRSKEYWETANEQSDN